MTYRHTTHFHSDYLDGELDPGRSVEINKHLAECEACKKDLDRLKNLKKSLRNIVVDDPGDDYFEDLSGRVKAQIEAIEPHQDRPQVVAKAGPISRNVMALKRLIQLSAAVTLLFGAFYLSGYERDESRFRPSADIAMNQAETLDSIVEAEFPIDPQSGINLTGPPYLTNQKTSESKHK